MDDSQNEVAELLAMMSKEFLRDTSQRVRSMRDDATEMAIATDPMPAMTRLIRSAHTIKGGGGTFGFSGPGATRAQSSNEKPRRWQREACLSARRSSSSTPSSRSRSGSPSLSLIADSCQLSAVSCWLLAVSC